MTQRAARPHHAIAALAVMWGFTLLAHVAPIVVYHYANPAVTQH